ncbi:protein of unknown function [Burkholderia multivorans]
MTLRHSTPTLLGEQGFAVAVRAPRYVPRPVLRRQRACNRKSSALLQSNASHNAHRMAFPPSVQRLIRPGEIQWLSPQSVSPSPAPQVKSVTRCCSASPMATCSARTSPLSCNCSTCRKRKPPSKAS